VDFTLSADSEQNCPALDIIPSGSNAVLAYAVYTANLGEGTVVGPSSGLLSPVWATSSSVITIENDIGVYGLFTDTSGYIGLELYVDGAVHYGFLQIDCRGYSGFGGFYEAYGYNTVAGQPITTTAVPEPFVLASLAAPQIVRPGNLRLNWDSEPGQPYQVQFKDRVDAPSWSNLDLTIIATSTNTLADVPIVGAARFFRVIQAQ